MLLTTTSQVDGKNIKEYRGIIFGEVANGINYQRDIMAGFTSVVGGRSACQTKIILIENLLQIIHLK